MKGKSGFTLIELLIVVGILGILTSFSFPTLFGFRDKICLDAYSRLAASQIRNTQGLAMAKSETCGWKASYLSLPGNISVLAGREFKFSSSGFPQVGKTGTETLKIKSGRIRKIILSSVGRVRIE